LVAILFLGQFTELTVDEVGMIFTDERPWFEREIIEVDIILVAWVTNYQSKEDDR